MIKCCKNCNSSFSTKNSNKQHCSSKCFKLYRNRPDIIAETIKKRKLTNLKKYGVDNAAKCDSIKEKTKQTCQRKYGANSPSENSCVRLKQEATNVLRYGVKNAFKNKNVQEKYHITMLNKYGTNSPLKNESIKTKLKNTCLSKYGVDNPSKSLIIKNKTAKTCLLKYGNTSPMKNDAVKNKMVQNRLNSAYESLVVSNRFNNVTLAFDKKEYDGVLSYQKKYKFKCGLCSLEFEDTLYSGNIPMCPFCYPSKVFYSQNEIYDYIKTIIPDVEILKNDRTVLSGKELDIYIPSKKIAIEYNGLYWHSDVSGQKNRLYHINKTELCEKNNIQLIHIFEDEWINKKEIVMNKLKHLLSTDTFIKRIYARNCTILEIDVKSKNEFLNKYHIQGIDKSSIRLGAFYNNNLVAVMTFGKLRLPLGNKANFNSKNNYEMYRFCTLTNIIGIGGKLFNFFIKNNDVNSIISYADRRWSNKNAFYNKIGFKLNKKTFPNYWYIDKNYSKRIYRFGFRKDKLKNILPKYIDTISEWENMKLNGYDRIWDCGSLKFVYEKNNKKS